MEVKKNFNYRAYRLVWIRTIVFIFCTSIVHSLSSQDVELGPDLISIPNIPTFKFYNDPDCGLDFNEIASLPEDAFSAITNGQITLDPSVGGCNWYRVNLKNLADADRRFSIKCNDTFIRFINCYILEQDSLVQEFKGGLAYSFDTRPIAHRNSIFPLDLPAHARRTVYLEIDNRWDSFQLSVDLIEEKELQKQISSEYITIGCILGFSFLQILLSIILFIGTKQRLFGYYLFYTISAMLSYASFNGIDYQFIYPGLHRFAHDSKLIISAFGILSLYLLVAQYIREQQSQEPPKTWHLKLALIGFIITILVASIQHSIIGTSDSVVSQFMKSVPPSLGLQIIAGVVLFLLIRQVKRQPIWNNVVFLIGFSGWLAIAFLSVLMNQGVVHINIPDYQFLSIGFVFEMTAIAIIMVDRIIKLQREKTALSFEVDRARLEKIQAVKLQELDAAKSRFYTNITHEFRTPLTVIKGLSEQIEGNEKKKILIQRNSNILLRLINRLLDLTKADKGELVLHPIQDDIVQYLKYLAESYRSWGAAKNIRLHFLPEMKECLMDFDPESIQEILSNLITNSIKYTEEGGDIYIFLEKEGSQLIIRVKDTGIGIEKKNLPHLFERFFQIPNDQSQQAGTGIGLALCKELVELMDGTISVASEPGLGSEFKVVLPITADAKRKDALSTFQFEETPAQYPVLTQDNSHSSETSESNEEQDLLLVIEDNEDVLHYITIFLQDNYKLLTAANGKEGEQLALEHIPDLVVSDIMMPEMNGLELCESLKTNILTSHVPIILLTAKVDQQAKVQGLMRGADAYISKPFDQTELLVRITKLIEQRKRIQKHYLSNSLNVRKKEHEAENEFLATVKKIILKEMNNPVFDVQWLSRQLGMSRSQLFRKLKALTGRSISSYVRYVRLQEGKKILESTQKSVSEIAYEVGFNDLSYFSKSFSEEFGYPPNATRK